METRNPYDEGSLNMTLFMYIKFLLSYAFWCFGLMNACYNSRKLARIHGLMAGVDPHV